MAPDVRRSTRLLAASIVVSWSGAQISGALSSVIALHLTGDLALAGVPYFFFALGSAAGAYPAGRLMDRVGRVPVLVGGHLLSGLGFFLGTLAIVLGTFPGFLAGVVVASLGSGTTYLTRMAAADLFPAARRGRGVALVVFHASLGAALGIPLLALAQATGARLGQSHLLVAWAMVVWLSVVAAAIVSRIRPDPRQVALEIQALEPAASDASGAVAAAAQGARRGLFLAALILVLAQGAMASVMSVAGASLDHAGHSANLISLTMTAHLVGMFFFSPWIGQVADRWGRRVVLLASATVLLAGAAVVVAFGASAWLAAGLLVVGVGWSFAFIGATAVIADVTPPLHRGRTAGLVDLAAAGCAALGALAGGWALATGGIERVGGVAVALTVGIALAASLVPLARRPTPTPTPA